MKSILWIAIALAGLSGAAFWLFQRPTPQNAPRDREAEAKTEGLPTGSSTQLPPPLVTRPVVTDEMDEGVRQITASLNDASMQPEDDLEAIQEILNLAARASGGHPSGENSDITSSLIGQGEGTFLPKSHPAVRDGELIDRWGTPYWFHPVTANTTEIRSAGPDRELFTHDDVILNDSGVTSSQSE